MSEYFNSVASCGHALSEFADYDLNATQVRWIVVDNEPNSQRSVMTFHFREPLSRKGTAQTQLTSRGAALLMFPRLARVYRSH